MAEVAIHDLPPYPLWTTVQINGKRYTVQCRFIRPELEAEIEKLIDAGVPAGVWCESRVGPLKIQVSSQP